MNRDNAIRNMVAPYQSRKGIWRDGILQIWITRACDKACFGCTQGSQLRGHTPKMSVEQFEVACQSLEDYFGVVGVFGGNPATHPQFHEICEVMKQYIPWEQRGLWCNNPLGKGVIMRETFNPAYSNLNVHLDATAYQEFKRDWPESKPFGLDSDSRHSPPWVAMQDVIEDESERWDLIANCDINKRWSALIGVFRGELRAWFCEIAGAQSMLHQNEPDYPDTGLAVEPNWWRQSIHSYAHQIDHHCHGCGIPLRGYGALATNESGAEQVSATHEAIFKTKRPQRLVQLVTDRNQLKEQSLQTVVDYVGNAKR